MSALPHWLRSPRVVAGLAMVAAIAVAAALAPLIVPNDPQEQHLIATLLPPAWSPAATPRSRSAPTASAAACSRA